MASYTELIVGLMKVSVTENGFPLRCFRSNPVLGTMLKNAVRAVAILGGIAATLNLQ